MSLDHLELLIAEAVGLVEYRRAMWEDEEIVVRVEAPGGRTVALDGRTWNHVLDEHPELTDQLEAVMASIASPAHREPDPRAGRERLFGRGGPHGWIRVVIEFAGAEDRIVTAFPQSYDPRTGGWSQ